MNPITLFLSAVLALRRPEAPPRWLWGLPVLFCLWANVHIQFVYGLLLLGLACAAPYVDRALGLADHVVLLAKGRVIYRGLAAEIGDEVERLLPGEPA